MYIKPLETIPEELRPRMIYNIPELQFPDEVNITDEVLEKDLKSKHNNVAIFFKDDRITYGELSEQVNKFAHVLKSQGIGRGDVVMLRMVDCPEVIICGLAIHKTGAVIMPTVALYREKMITYLVNKAEARMMIVGQELFAEVDKGKPDYKTVEKIMVVGKDVGPEFKEKGCLIYSELMSEADEEKETVFVEKDELAIKVFTGGTTGRPKGIMHTAAEILATIRVDNCIFPTDFGPGDVVAGAPPLGFYYGYYVKNLLPLKVGASVALIAGRPTVESSFEIMQRHKVTVWCGAPTLFKMMLDDPNWEKYDLSSVKSFLSSSAALLPLTFEQWKKRYGKAIINLMGGNEILGAFVATWRPPLKPNSLGYAFPGYNLAVLDDKGNPCPLGEIGRFAVQGPTGAVLIDDLEGQKKAVVNGWSFTGDAVYMDEDGCFWHASRTDDVIKTRGYRVSPEEVEDTLSEHPDVKEAAVIGVPDDVKGQAVKAFVILRDKSKANEAMAEELKSFGKQRLAAFAGPHHIQFVEKIPKTELLKINRKVLREMG